MTVKSGYSISDISAIKALPTALLLNGYARLCRSVNAWFSYNSTSTAAADDVSVLLPASGTGRWFKLKADVAATDVLNFNESVDDRVAALVQNSSTISASYNDAANTLTFSVIAGSIDETELTDSGVIAGSYTNATVTVDSKGRVTSATSGDSLANPMTEYGEIIYGGASGIPLALPPNLSFTKKHLTQYATSLWDLDEITTDFWINLQDSATLTISGGVIDSIADKSGNGRNATQTGSNRPTYQATGFNGLPCAFMADINDFFSLPTIPRNDGQLVFAIIDTTDCPTYSGTQGYLPFIGSFYLGFENLYQFRPAYVNGTAPAYIVAPTTGRRKFGVMLYYSSSTGGIQIDASSTYSRNISESSGNWGTSLCVDATAFSDYSTAGIKICEVAIINPSSVSPTNIDKIWGCMMWRWGLESLLPSGHPYKTSAPRAGSGELISIDWEELDTFSYTKNGLVPAPLGSGVSRYLREDGGWGTPSGSAASITVLDEDATLTSAATSFNFKGAGVEATNTGGDVTITIPYSNKSGYEFISENLSVPLVFYWDDYYALPVNYATKNRFSVVGTEPLRDLLDNTTGLRFLGASSGHYSIANSIALQITGNITYFAVVWTGTIPSTNSLSLQGILVKQTGVANGISLNILSSNFYAEFTNNSGTTFSITSSVTLASNTKYVVLAYRNGANCYLNVNGTIDSISTFSGTNIVQSDPLRLGNKASINFGFEGIIQMAGICNGAVSSTDITFLLGLDYTKFPYL